MPDDMEKLVVDLSDDDPVAAEVLWGKPLDETQYELRSVPVLAYGLAFGDIVEAVLSDDGRKRFLRLVRPGGLLTVRAAGAGADRERFAELRRTLASVSEATQHVSDTYSAFSLTPETYKISKTAIDDAEAGDTITVEIANGPDDDESPLELNPV